MKRFSRLHRAVSLTLLALLAGCRGEPTQSTPAPSSSQAPAPVAAAANPVQAEMRILDEVVRDWVTAIANNQLAAIPAGVEKIHPAREATERALERGEYRPPKGDAQAFMRQDEEFHDGLVALLQAARANDLPAATKKLGVVLEGCTACHMKHRF